MNRLRRLLDLFPLTPGGALLIALCAVAVKRYGLDRADLVLFVAGVIGLALAAIALLAVVGTAIVLAVRLRDLPPASPLELEVGRWSRSGFGLVRPWFVPFVAIEWRWVAPVAESELVAEGWRLVERVRVARRGEADAIERRIEVGDAFGIARIGFRCFEPRRLRFLPATGALEQVHVVQGLAGGDAMPHPDGPPAGDQVDMRHYAAGDPIRYVLWKVFARSRELVVRQPEHALAPARQTIAYLVSGDGDEPAAGAAKVAVRCGSLGQDWRFGADGIGDVARSPGQALDLIVRSGNASPSEAGAGLGAFLQRAQTGPVSRAVVFVPPKPGPWLDRVVSAANGLGRGAALEFVICTDGVGRADGRNPLARLLLAAPPADGPGESPSADVAAVIRGLARCRGKVTLVDRAAGRVFPQAHLDRLLARGAA